MRGMGGVGRETIVERGDCVGGSCIVSRGGVEEVREGGLDSGGGLKGVAECATVNVSDNRECKFLVKTDLI